MASPMAGDVTNGPEAAAAEDRRWEVDLVEAQRVGYALDRAIDGPRAGRHVTAAFEPGGPELGATFELLAPGDATALDTADLLAASLAGVRLTPVVVRAALGASRRVASLLRPLPVDADLRSARPVALAGLVAALEGVQEVSGLDELGASTLLARKRPRLASPLMPATAKLLDLPTARVWPALRTALGDAGRRERVDALRPSWLPAEVSTLRVLDAALRGAASQRG